MQEHYYFIGEIAGKIYQTLEKQGALAPTRLQKEIGVEDSALFNQAIGWLAREDKINVTKQGKGTKVSLL
ncbi:MAG: hypothetical protein FGM27_09100 [Candidatus Omnitrophica bacterium]|nr:hypothetical protein [Candidatus Omnitrophota bacterium]